MNRLLREPLLVLVLGALLFAQSIYAQTPAEAVPEVKAMLEPWTGDLDGMVKRRYIRMLVVVNKTNYFIDRNRAYGATVEASRAFEAMVNKKLGPNALNVTIALVPVARNNLLPALAAGRGDIAAANLTVTPERAQLVDFGAPLMKGVREVLVTSKTVPEVATVDGLSGMRIFVRRSSSFYESLLAQNEIFKKANKKPIDIVAADERLEVEDLLEMVNVGIVPATLVDEGMADFWASVFPNLRVHHGAAVRTDGAIAWAIRKGSPKLKAMVDEFAQTHGKGTVFGNITYKRYLKDNVWVKNPAAQAELARFEQTVDFFRMYGDKYDLPWMLVAAQAYQESGIDQSKKNPSGAVGIMQIKPSTAAGQPILVQGVDQSAEKNIEAGAKYLRFIVDQYYKDEPMDRIDKGLFAIASYNAGPARIARLRKETQKMGLDPNKWFGNVEVAVANDIGRETVQYVSNIYKYYVTYTLVMEERKGRDEARAGLTE